jgi:Flp pilus assembly pilin Flp
MRIAKPLLRDRRGVTAVEFAILAPAMITLICGSLELGHMLFARVALEGAVVEAARTATATLESTEVARMMAMRNSVIKTMTAFPIAKGRSIAIETKVYKDFSTAYPEDYNDANQNKHYDLGETFFDRNKNGKWDAATPISGTAGGAGDVLSLTVTYPKGVLFNFLNTQWALGSMLELKASTVVRNEAVVRKTP